MNKQELRQEIRLQKRHFTRQQLEEMSLPVISRLLSHSRITSANTIMMYCSLPDEVDTRRAIDVLLERGCKVVLPAVISDTEMELRECNGMQDLKEGAFHILEPTGKPFTRYEEIDVAVIPGMSFDTSGNRLGRGKGYYDRFLAQHLGIHKIGICFDFQKRESVPSAKDDIQIDEVL